MARLRSFLGGQAGSRPCLLPATSDGRRNRHAALRFSCRPAALRCRVIGMHAPLFARRREGLLALMCDDDSFDDMVAYRLRSERLSRRGFGTLSLGAGLASLLPIGCQSAGPAPGPVPAPSAAASGAAIATTESEVSITTPDGACDAYFVHPTNAAAPAVLVWPDIFGLRPAFRQMGKRLAESGYAVLVVNPFYRTKKAPTSSPHADFEDPATREALMGLAHSLTPETEVTDAKALTAWLDQQPSVDKSRKMGTTGYCMGGPLVF